jgi:hypothetical protein
MLMTELTKTTTPAKRPRRMAREPKTDRNVGQDGVGTSKASEPVGRADRPQAKTNLILGLLRSEEGATPEQLVAATGWLPHTTRAALTGIKRKGHLLSHRACWRHRTMMIEQRISWLQSLSSAQKKAEWRRVFGTPKPPAFGTALLVRALTSRGTNCPRWTRAESRRCR